MQRLVLALVFAALMAWLLLIPPFIGIANNGDFGKVAGHLSLFPVDGQASHFIYFQPNYVHASKYYWDTPYSSSETVLAWIALYASRATVEDAAFDLRWMGLVHCALVLVAIALLPRKISWFVAALALLAFTDICYTANFNSFYMDAAAICALLMMAAAAWRIAAADGAPWYVTAAFAVAALLFVTSKPQHAIWAWIPALFLLSRVRRRAWLLPVASAVIVLGAGYWSNATADQSNRAQAIFDKLFWDIGKAADGPAVLRELGVQPDEMRYIGTHAFSKGSPAQDRPWAEAFLVRTGYGRLGRWYVRHPARTAGMLWRTLAADAKDMGSPELSNFRREDRQGPEAQSDRLSAWSTFRGWLFRVWPAHMVIWYAVFVSGALWTALRGGAMRRWGWIALAVAVLGAGEFLVASLADAIDNGRHLLIFHLATDLTFCLAVAWAVGRGKRLNKKLKFFS